MAADEAGSGGTDLSQTNVRNFDSSPLSWASTDKFGARVDQRAAGKDTCGVIRLERALEDDGQEIWHFEPSPDDAPSLGMEMGISAG
jgi:hypothetical protein